MNTYIQVIESAKKAGVEFGADHFYCPSARTAMNILGCHWDDLPKYNSLDNVGRGRKMPNGWRVLCLSKDRTFAIRPPVLKFGF